MARSLLANADLSEAGMMNSLKLLSTLLILLTSAAATAGPLYSWTTKDGTPTYSPDPPPNGVSYVIVGPDLKPLAGQPVVPAAPQNLPSPSAAVTPETSGNLVLTPAPRAATKSNTAKATAKTTETRAKWKPVIYADDPNPKSNKPESTAAATVPEPAVTQPNQMVNGLTPECFNIQQRLLLLENQFANALTAQQMDDAIVRLSAFRNQNKGNCGL